MFQQMFLRLKYLFVKSPQLDLLSLFPTLQPVIKVQRVRFTEQQSCLLNLLKYQRQRMDIERYWRGILTEDFLFIRPNKGSDGSFLKLTLYSMGYQPAS